MGRYHVLGERKTLDGISQAIDITWYAFSDEQKMAALEALYDHHDKEVLNGRHTGIQLYSCYECGHTHIGGFGTMNVKLDPITGIYERVKDDLTILTVHQEIAKAIRK